MAEIFNMHIAKTNLSRLVERALAGDDVVIGRNGKPLVRLVPVPASPARRVPGRSRGRIRMAPDFNEMSGDELSDWEGR